MNSKKNIFVFVFIFFIASAAFFSYPSRADSSNDKKDSEDILLKSRTISTPELSPSELKPFAVPSPLFQKRKHILLKLDDIPSEEKKKDLEKQGIKLLKYIPKKAWLASIPEEKFNQLVFQSDTFVSELLPEDKISPKLMKKIPDWIKNNDGSVNLTVLFFSDILPQAIESTIQKYGTISENIISIPENKIRDLAGEDIVEWIETPPAPLIIFNDDSRALIGVDTLHAAPYNLNGTGVVAAMWDAGWANHSDYNSRTTRGDTSSSNHYHATHVAGTMLGDGNLSSANSGTANQWIGMAPNASLITYEWPNSNNELYSETNSSIADYGAILSQNSWGYNTAVDCDFLGVYDSRTVAFDEVINGINVDDVITIVFSSGNERDNSNCNIPSNPYNTTTGPGGTAKNVITVGAVTSGKAMSTFSSWGPTDDGRIKPDVVAMGVGVKSTYTSDTYASLSGTSMSSPAVSGTILLIHQDFKRLNNQDPLPSTDKALLIHTAEDLNNTGPDYTTGWGLVNATAAIDKVREDAGSEVIIESSLSNGESSTYYLSVPSGESELKLTLVWDDYPGTALAAKELVNDIDLIVKNSTGDIFYPWTLSPDSPGAYAVQNAADDTNNVEQVYVSSPDAGVWTVIVNGTSIPQAPETFSLVSSIPLSFSPKLEDETYGMNISSIGRGESWQAYAKWDKPINFSFVEYNISSSLFNTTAQSFSSNWTNHTNTTSNEWSLGAHALKFYVNDSEDNWNATPSLSFNLFGWSEINESSFPSSMNEDASLDLACRVRDSNTSDPIENYPVNFYDNSSLLGSNTSNSSGWASLAHTFNIPGSFLLTCNISDSPSLFYNISQRNYNLSEITVNDITFPQYSLLKNTSAIYNAIFQANASWTDNYILSSVLFESNFSGVLTNYTPQNITDEYFFDIQAGNQTAGKYILYKWYAGDSSGNWNSSNKFNYTVAKASTSIDLFLNGTQENKTYIQGQVANITASIDISGKNISIDANFTGSQETISSGLSPLTNFTNTFSLNTSIYNITAYFSGDENYTPSSVTYFLSVRLDNSIACSLSSDCFYGFCVHNICRSASTYCGDAFCDTGETCSSCSADCGSCSVTAGGGGGGGSLAVADVSETKTITEISKDETKAIEISDSKSNTLKVGGVSISAREAVSDVKITVKESSRPSAAPLPIASAEGSVYKYVDISTNMKDKIENTKINFKVEHSWIAEKNIDEASILLARWTESNWEKLATAYLNEDKDYIYYEAVSSGFSTFAITGEKQKACKPKEKKCVGKEAQECKLDGSKWDKVKICDYKCEAGKCVEKPVEEEPKEKEEKVAQKEEKEDEYFFWGYWFVLFIFLSMILVLFFTNKKK